MLYLKIFFWQLFLTFFVLNLSNKLNFYDRPNSRKIHTKPVPYTGGIIISLTLLFVVFITDYDQKNLNLLLSFSILSCLSGFLDDKYNITPGTKLVLQAITIYILISEGIYLTDLGYFDYIGTLSLGSFDKIFTLLSCLLLINACNYSDGTDGQLSIITGIIILSYFVFLLLLKEIKLNFLLIIIFPFLIFSLFNIFGEKYKCFLGDSGSNLAGYLISFISIIMYQVYNIHPVIIIWSLAYLVFEFLAVNIFRYLNKKNIFEAGQDHLHYLLIKKYDCSHKLILLIISTINIFLISLGYFAFNTLNKEIILLLYLFIFLMYLFIRYWFFKESN